MKYNHIQKHNQNNIDYYVRVKIHQKFTFSVAR